jgi:urease accessory protein
MLEIGDLPDELRADSDPVRGGLGVGAPGKVGRLDLALAPQAGSTRVCRHYQRSPLHVYRPIYLDANRPDMAFIFLQQYGDGLVQGDRYRIDVDCAPGSAVHITTQAATKVYAARQNYAAQLVNLRAGAGAVVEYLPDPVLPFRGSRLFQRLCLTVHHEASVILVRLCCPGGPHTAKLTPMTSSGPRSRSVARTAHCSSPTCCGCIRVEATTRRRSACSADAT